MTIGGIGSLLFSATALTVFVVPFQAESCAQAAQDSSRMPGVVVVVDPRDGTVYRTVQSGSQIWLGENVRFETEDSWIYEGDTAKAATFGRLYDWEGALGACPPGWHLPTTSEWRELFNHVGGLEVAGGALKEAGTTHWREPNTGATNITLFGGLPGGARRNQGGTYHGLGLFGAFWSSTEKSKVNAWAFFLGYHYSEVSPRASTEKSFGFSVRCVASVHGSGVELDPLPRVE